MSAARWAAARVPAAPPALAAHVAQALVEVGDESDVVEACLTAAERTLERVLAEGGTARAAALDLLTADALVTYAFEAASETPDRLPEVARDAMARLSRFGVTAPAAAP